MDANKMNTMMVSLDEITVADRIRKDNGDIDGLAQSISERGLLNPITLMEQDNGGYVLIAGLRRLNAVRSLGEKEIRATVMSAMEADETPGLEIAENEQRKEFTVTERLAYAERIKAMEEEKARTRMLIGKHIEEVTDPVSGRAQGEATGRTRDIVAKKAGFTSSRQMHRAETVAKERPDLVDKIDKKELTITGAYDQAMAGAAPAKPTPNKAAFIEERRVEIEPLLPFNPIMVEIPAGKTGLEAAHHDQLMTNIVYQQLFAHYQEALQQANLARGELRTRSEGYERRIRAYEENTEAMRREIAQLKEARRA